MSIYRFITIISYVNQDLFQSLAGSKVKSGQVSDKNRYSEGVNVNVNQKGRVLFFSREKIGILSKINE